MERDRFNVTADMPDGQRTNHQEPVLRVRFRGSRARFESLLRDRVRGAPQTAAIDVSFRTRGDADGVLFLTDRETGTYILEIETNRTLIEEFTSVVRTTTERADAAPEFSVVLTADGDEIVRFDADGLLVYDADGLLQRDASLIPTDVGV